jgi:hypothetical protein
MYSGEQIPTTKSTTTIIFSDFMYLPPVIQAEGGPIEERLFFEANLILEKRYLRGTDIQ